MCGKKSEEAVGPRAVLDILLEGIAGEYTGKILVIPTKDEMIQIIIICIFY